MMRRARFAVLSVCVFVAGATIIAQQGAKGGEWPNHGGDKGFTRYSPLDQINKDTIAKLRIAWRRPAIASEFSAKNPGLGEYLSVFESTPLMVNGVLYAPDGMGLIEAFNPSTGKTLWVQEPPVEGEVMAAGQSSRGVAYSRDGADQRLLSVRRGFLIATDPETGKLIRSFGVSGKVDLGVYEDTPKPVNYRWSSAPIVVKGVVIVGSALVGRPGDVRGYDAKTGKLRWTFHVIPRPGEFGNDTWLDGSWNGLQGGESDPWAMITADEELGLVYLPTSAATNNMNGVHRPGNNLFSSSIVCLRAETGERVWHFQTVHHDIFDYDNATGPILMDITVDGKAIKAVVQLTKQAMAFVFDRVTGVPVWPIEERPVPKGNTPGEWYSPTQPFPTKPAPYDRHGITTDDLIDFTPELRAEAEEIAKKFVIGPVFTPPSTAGPGPAGKLGTLQMPGQVGGTNWPGAAFDPETKKLYVPSVTGAFYILLTAKNPGQPGENFRGLRAGVRGPAGLPLTKPPYGRITAIDMNTGEVAWMVPNGDGPRNHPAIKHLNLPPLGQTGRSAILVTKSLLFVSEGDQSMRDMPPGSGPDAGRKLRAYDKGTGAVVWETELPAGTNGSLMTYLSNGKQYIVMPIGSRTHAAEFVALSLP